MLKSDSTVFTRSVEKLLQSYELDGHVNHNGLNLPSRSSIQNLLELFEAILFPGFAQSECIDASELETWTVTKCEQLISQIKTLVRQICAYRSHIEGSKPAPCDDYANQIALDVIGALPNLRELISTDIQALFDGDPAVQSKHEVVLAYPGLRAIWVYRVAHEFWKQDMRLLARMMSETVHGKTGIDIHPGAQIGKAFYIDHGTGVVIGETTIIGDHVKMYQGVSLGALSVSRKKSGTKRHPTIEDHVTLYAGATILGGETTVGHHSIVGGNVWLVKSVPAFSVVSTAPQIQVRPKKETEEAWSYEI